MSDDKILMMKFLYREIKIVEKTGGKKLKDVIKIDKKNKMSCYLQ